MMADLNRTKGKHRKALGWITAGIGIPFLLVLVSSVLLLWLREAAGLDDAILALFEGLLFLGLTLLSLSLLASGVYLFFRSRSLRHLLTQWVAAICFGNGIIILPLALALTGHGTCPESYDARLIVDGSVPGTAGHPPIVELLAETEPFPEAEWGEGVACDEIWLAPGKVSGLAADDRLAAVILMGGADRRDLRPTHVPPPASNAELRELRIEKVRSCLEEVGIHVPITKETRAPGVEETGLSSRDYETDRTVRIYGVLWSRPSPEAQRTEYRLVLNAIEPAQDSGQQDQVAEAAPSSPQ